MNPVSELDQIYKSIVSWGAPLVVMGILHYLQKISASLNDIKLTLGKNVQKTDYHEKRLDQHEAILTDSVKRITFLENGHPVFHKIP